MKTDLNPKSVFRTTLALAIALGFGSRLVNAQDAAVPEAEAAEEVAEEATAEAEATEEVAEEAAEENEST